jgi:hypothetical protein
VPQTVLLPIHPRSAVQALQRAFAVNALSRRINWYVAREQPVPYVVDGMIYLWAGLNKTARPVLGSHNED